MASLCLIAVAAGALFFAHACARHDASGGSDGGAGLQAARTPLREAGASSAARPNDRASCGELDCLVFDSAEAAFAHVVSTRPRVLAVGEAHAQKDVRVASATARFRETLLPLLRGRASDLVIELWVATGKCGKRERTVKQQQQKVTVSQASGNQSEFVALGSAAKTLGIVPHALVPTCDEYAAIAKSGPDDVARMLQMIAETTSREVTRLLALHAADAGPTRMIVAYGGLLHNDVAPRPGRELFSFGPELSRASASRYVELDLVVREFVKDTDAWRSQPFYQHFDGARFPNKALLYRPSPRSYVLVFPAS